MDDQSNRKWLLAASVVLLIMVSIWVLAVLQLRPAAAGGDRISLSLRSRLGADYGPNQGQTLGSLSLSIVSDMMADLGLDPLVAEELSDDMRIAMLTPVPTATALNFEGDAPPSITPSNTPIPTSTPSNTPTLTLTATNTPRPSATSTPTPTKAAATAKPATATPSCTDCKKPTIKGATLSPSGGDLGSCTSPKTIVISDMHVIDPDFSSGMNWVGVKYKFQISGGVYNFVELSKTGGPGWTTPGSTWDAKYGGSLTIDFSKRYGSLPAGGRALAKQVPYGGWLLAVTDTPTPTPTFTPTPTTYNIEVHGKAEDNAGNISYLLLGTYTCTE